MDKSERLNAIRKIYKLDTAYLLSRNFAIAAPSNQAIEAFQPHLVHDNSHVWMIAALRDNENPLTVGKMAKYCGIRINNIHIYLKKLEEMQLVRRYVNPKDRREILVELTEQGKQYVETNNTIREYYFDYIFKRNLTEDELKEYVDCLERLLALTKKCEAKEPMNIVLDKIKLNMLEDGFLEK